MNVVSTLASTPATTIAAPFKVGNFDKGTVNGDVSRQWIARPHDQRFLSLTDLRASVHARRTASREDVVDVRKIEILAPEIKTREDLSRLYVGTEDGRLVAPTHWSFGQMAALARAPAGYLRSLPSTISADALTYGLRYLREASDVKLYATQDEIRAVTSPSYGRIFDADVVDAVINLAGDGRGSHRWKIPGVLNWSTMMYDPEAPVSLDSTTLYASDRDVYVFLVDDRNPVEVGKLKDGSPDYMFRGVIVSNSEVGAGTARIAGFWLRAVCMNRNLWGCEGFEEISIRHTRSAPERWIDEARPALTAYAEGTARSFVEAVATAKAAKVAADEDEAIDFLVSRSFSRKASIDMLKAFEQDEGEPARSAWDMTQAATAWARSIPYQDDRIVAERIAGKICDDVVR
jgi:hypothetical protein